jgi:hypothetical protein
MRSLVVWDQNKPGICGWGRVGWDDSGGALWYSMGRAGKGYKVVEGNGPRTLGEDPGSHPRAGGGGAAGSPSGKTLV